MLSNRDSAAWMMINFVLPELSSTAFSTVMRAFEIVAPGLSTQFTFFEAAVIFFLNMVVLLQTEAARKAFIVTIWLNFAANFFLHVNIVFMTIHMMLTLPMSIEHLSICPYHPFNCLFPSLPFFFMFDY